MNFVHNITCKKCSVVFGTMKLSKVPDQKELGSLGKIGWCQVCAEEEKTKTATMLVKKVSDNV